MGEIVQQKIFYSVHQAFCAYYTVFENQTKSRKRSFTAISLIKSMWFTKSNKNAVTPAILQLQINCNFRRKSCLTFTTHSSI